MSGLFGNIIKYALILGAAGQLVDAVIDMGNQAAEANRLGIVSLRSLNNQLWHASPPAHHR